MKRLAWLVVAFLFLATGMAQIELDPKIETVLLQLEQELTEYQQRVLAERLVVIRVPIDQLLRIYQTNEKNANKLYKGNLVEFTGRIVDIARQGKLYLFLESPQAPRPLDGQMWICSPPAGATSYFASGRHCYSAGQISWHARRFRCS